MGTIYVLSKDKAYKRPVGGEAYGLFCYFCKNVMLCLVNQRVELKCVK